jgi:hypothetical protein
MIMQNVIPMLNISVVRGTIDIIFQKRNSVIEAPVPSYAIAWWSSLWTTIESMLV